MHIKKKYDQVLQSCVRSLRKASAAEVLFIIKRSKRDKVDKYKEIEVAKNVKHEELARYYLRKAIRGELRTALKISDDISPYRGASTEEKNVIARLLKSKPFQERVKSGISMLNDALEESDSDIDHPKSERKNRRGQRARRAIMELKHGRNAAHLVKEREQRQREFDERAARRAAREVKSEANAIVVRKPLPMHESWQAAKLRKAALNVQPAGQKIVFDE